MLRLLELLLKSAVLYCVSSALWYTFRNFVIKSTISDIPGPKRDSWLWGNLKKVYSPQGVPWHLSMPRRFGRAFKIHGILGDEQIYVTDPLALHHIVVKDQNIYEETSMFISGNQLNFGNSLLGTLGDTHRKQRKILNPVFSIAHMRNLAPIFYSTAHELRDALMAQFKTCDVQEIDMRPWVSKTALELIGRGGFGYTFDVFGEDTRGGNEYRKQVKDFTGVLFSLGVVRQFLPFFAKLGPPQFRRFLLNIAPSKRLHKMRDIVDTMYATSQKVYEERRKEVEDGFDGKDIMSVLVRANQALDDKDRLTEEELVAQINTFIFAGSDTTTSAINRVLHLLSMNPDVQDKLRAEIAAAKDERGGEDLDHDTLMALPYLDAITRETLRLHSPVTFLSRTTRADISLPLSQPITNNKGVSLSAVPLRNNTNVIIGIAAANRDKEIWGEDADEWKPDRWMGKGWVDVASAGAKLPGVYSGMMTFLGGSRACIGFKFSQLELKIVLITLLEQFQFSLPDGQDIIWQNCGLLTPSTKQAADRSPRLPLKVNIIRPGA